MSRLAVFGTSSNPFCLHHEKCVRWLLDDGFDRVLIVPSAAHPLKTDLPPFPHRFAIAKIGASNFSPDVAARVEVTSLEEELAAAGEGPVYAYDLLRAVRARWGDLFETIKFSIGPDIPSELHRWKFVAEIEREFGFVHTPAFGAHATEVRRRIAVGDPRWRDLVHASVADYIAHHGVYPGSMPAAPQINADG
jgi:nicotinic acid mononucleotide adenylyltransferase